MGRALSLSVCASVLAVFALLAGVGEAPAQIRQDLCSKRDPGNPSKRHVGIILQANEDFYRMLLDGGERITLDARDYEVCPQPAAPEQAGRATPPVPPPAEPPPAAPPAPASREGLLAETVIDAGVADRLTVLGSGTMSRGVMPKVIEAFANARGARLARAQTGDTASFELTAPQQSRPFLAIEVTASGSRASLPALIDRKAQVGLSSAAYSEDQIATLLSLRGLSSRSEIEHVLALDGVVIVVHPQNPVRTLALCDVARIYAGKITNWQAVGGPPQPIRTRSLFITSGTFEVFQDLVLRRCGEVMSDRAIPHINQPGLRDAVAADRASIGFLGKSELTPAVTAISIGGECGLEVAPTSFNIKSEDYLLSRRLYVYTPSSVGRNGQAFLDFALSHPLAQEALKGGETTDQTIEVADIDNRAQRFAGLPENQDAMFGVFQRDTRGAQRFSLSFRFQFGSDRLDIKAEADILRLVDYLNRTRPRGEVLLAGFADSVGPAGENRLLAERRARSVRDAVAMIDRRLASGMAVKGYGEVMPVTCNDTDLGREKNRRVEVWLRSR